MAGAQAADLPLKAKPVQYVKICTLYGDGYYYIPGTDTCIRIGGYIRMDVGWNAAGARVPAYSGTQGAQDRTVSQMSTRARGNVAQADCILGLEMSDFWNSLNSFKDGVHRTSRHENLPAIAHRLEALRESIPQHDAAVRGVGATR